MRILCHISTIHHCSWPEVQQYQSEQQLVYSTGLPWLGSAGTISAVFPHRPPSCRSCWVHRQIASLRDLAGAPKSSSPSAPPPPLLQSEVASCSQLSLEGDESPLPPPANRDKFVNSPQSRICIIPAFLFHVEKVFWPLIEIHPNPCCKIQLLDCCFEEIQSGIQTPKQPTS